MRVLLIQPCGVKEVREEYVSTQFPMNLGYIAAALQNDGHDVRLLDFNVQNIDLSDYILKFTPAVVGLTAMTPAINAAGEIAKKIKEVDPKIFVVLGGVHASALPAETMDDFPEVDFIVYGEGEETAKELFRAIEGEKNFDGITGIIYRKDNKIIKNAPRPLIKNLDEIAFPARDLVDMSYYKKSHVSRGFSRKYQNILELMTSRGCPNRCIFCAGHINYGVSLRFRSFENVAAEITECVKKYGINHISIEDDTFTLNRQLVEQFCDFCKSRRLTWNCNSRVNTVTFDLLKKMSESGCRKISFGVESGSPRILGLIKKGITLEQVKNAFKLAKAAGIRYIEGTFILGCHIDETPEDIEMTKKLIWELLPDFVMLSVMCPFPGTEIYEDMRREGYLPDKPNWDDFSFFIDREKYGRLRHITHAELNIIQRDVIKKYFTSPRYIWSQLKKMRSLSEFLYFANLGAAYVKKFLFKK